MSNLMELSGLQNLKEDEYKIRSKLNTILMYQPRLSLRSESNDLYRNLSFNINGLL